MSEIDFNTTNEDPIVIEEPKDVTWATVHSYTVRREGSQTIVTVGGELTATNCRLVVYQSGPRHHFTFRILQQCKGAVGGDQMVPFEWTTTIGGIGGGATFLDGVGEIQVRAPFVAARSEGGDGPFPSTPDIDRPFPLGAVATEITIVGTLTDEGVECRAMREDDTEKLYTLVPRQKLSGFANGEHVKVIGRIAQVSFCMQGTTISVDSIDRI